MITTLNLRTMAAICSVALVSACGESTEVDNPAVTNIAGQQSTPIVGANDSFELMNSADNTWVAITGTVISVTPNSFVLDHGPDNITVEMDDFDSIGEAGALRAGDKVVVRGRVDQDIWESKKIEAASVFVKSLNSFFYASSADEETVRGSLFYVPRQDDASDVVGRVTSIEGREFTIGTGPSAVRVDTSSMGDNPLDVKGSPRINVGDRIYAFGTLDIDSQERVELMATGIVSLLSTAARTISATPSGQRGAPGAVSQTPTSASPMPSTASPTPSTASSSPKK